MPRSVSGRGMATMRYLRWSNSTAGDDKIVVGTHPLDGLDDFAFVVRNNFDTFKSLSFCKHPLSVDRLKDVLSPIESRTSPYTTSSSARPIS
jgi:hypothetical protein